MKDICNQQYITFKMYLLIKINSNKKTLHFYRKWQPLTRDVLKWGQSLEAFTCIREFFEYCSICKFIMTTQAKTGFLGICMALKSVYIIASTILNEMHLSKVIYSYFFSQDLLEIFHGQIRKKGVCNINPTTIQFRCTNQNHKGKLWLVKSCPNIICDKIK